VLWRRILRRVLLAGLSLSLLGFLPVGLIVLGLPSPLVMPLRVPGRIFTRVAGVCGGGLTRLIGLGLGRLVVLFPAAPGLGAGVCVPVSRSGLALSFPTVDYRSGFLDGLGAPLRRPSQ
jgi:hypothetical protein